jgi:hypothetical protein
VQSAGLGAGRAGGGVLTAGCRGDGGNAEGTALEAIGR